jgi:hypothetical protein
VVAQVVSAAMPRGVEERIALVHQPLRTCGILVPQLLRTRNQEAFIPLPKSQRLRLMTVIYGRQLTKVGARQAEYIGDLVARLHGCLASLPETVRWVVSDLQDTRRILCELHEWVLCSPAAGAQFRSLAAGILESGRTMTLDLPENGEQIIAGHGDLRLANIMFDASGQRPIGLVDLDTMGRMAWGDEIGDLSRSIATAAELAGADLPELGIVLAGLISGLLKHNAEETTASIPAVVGAMIRIQSNLSARYCLCGVGRVAFDLGAGDPSEHERIAAARAKQAHGRALRWLAGRAALEQCVRKALQSVPTH